MTCRTQAIVSDVLSKPRRRVDPLVYLERIAAQSDDEARECLGQCAAELRAQRAELLSAARALLAALVSEPPGAHPIAAYDALRAVVEKYDHAP